MPSQSKRDDSNTDKADKKPECLFVKEDRFCGEKFLHITYILLYLSNHFGILAKTVTDLYKYRWQIVQTESGSNG